MKGHESSGEATNFQAPHLFEKHFLSKDQEQDQEDGEESSRLFQLSMKYFSITRFIRLVSSYLKVL